MNFKITGEMIDALKTGDHQVFEKVFLYYFKNVKTFVNRLIKSEHDAEEISQDLFVKLWINRNVIDVSKNFNNFIYSSAKNAAFDYIRSKNVRDNFANDLIGEEKTQCTEEEYYAKEIALLIEVMVSQMPEQRRRVYILSRNEGKSNDEISEMLHISKRTVETHLNLALKELRKVIKSALALMG